MSDAEHLYVSNGIQCDLRNDGRGCHEYRPVEFELGVVPQASGSSRIHVGSTDVVIGVKVEVGSPDPSTPDEGRVHASVELSPCASPAFEGKGGDELASHLGKLLDGSLSVPGGVKPAGIDKKSLNIITGKTCWIVYVDALVLNAGGNVLDAISLAAKAALAHTRIPKVDIIADEEGGEAEIELDDDPSSAIPLNTGHVPIITTVTQVGKRSVVDLTAEEEACGSNAIHVAVTPQGDICGMTLSGCGAVHHSMLQEMLEVADRVARALHTGLDSYLKQQPGHMER